MMYAFVDRPVESLHNGGRFLLWAMRGWSHAVDRKICPPQALRRGFAAVGALPALPDFHVTMALLAGDGLEPLALSPMGSAQIAETEAILLQLWSATAQGCIESTQATLALLLEPDSIRPTANAMMIAAARLLTAGFDLENLSNLCKKHQESR